MRVCHSSERFFLYPRNARIEHSRECRALPLLARILIRVNNIITHIPRKLP